MVKDSELGFTMKTEYDIPSDQGLVAKLFHHGSGKHQILLVHGFHSSEKIWLPPDNDDGFSVADALVERGFGCWLLRLSDPVNGDIEQLTMNDLWKACRIIQSKTGTGVYGIAAHSMGGVITRLLIARKGRKDALSELKKVALLAVPNHGISMTYFLKQAARMDEVIPRVISIVEEKMSVSISRRAYYQLLEISPVIQYINEENHFLHRDVCWYNAIASKDVVVPRESAAFTEEEIHGRNITCFEQRVFRATHMYNSLQLLDNIITPMLTNKLSTKQKGVLKETLRNAMNILDYVIAPPIYRSKECFEWWVQRLEPSSHS